MMFCFLSFCWFLPAAAEGFDQGDSGDELLTTEGRGGKLDVQRGALSGCHFEIGDEAVTVLVINNLELSAGRDQGVVFRSVLVGKKRLGRKVVLHFRESC